MNKTQLAEKKKTKLQKRKLIRRKNESNREIKQDERIQRRENIIEDIDIGRFSELATTGRKYVNGLKLHEIKNEILEEYTADFQLNG